MDTDMARLPRRPAPSRQIVVVPRTQDERPDVPLRAPSHFCIDCGQMHVRCFQCDLRLPIVSVRDGFHRGHCDTHGQVVFVCPAKPSLSSHESAALASQPLDLPKQLTYIPETEGGPLNIEHDHRMREYMRVGAACFLAGFVLCAVLMLGAQWLGRYIGG